MIINVKGIDIETKEIVAIRAAGWRMHGFIIYLTEGRTLNVCEKQVYDMVPSDCAYINEKYRKIETEIRKYWEQDKRDVHVIGF